MATASHNIWEKKGTTGIFRLNGYQGNYLSDPEFEDLSWLNERFSEPDLKAIIITGSGRHFSAGADLKRLGELATNEAMLISKMKAGKDLLDLIESTALPVVAEIQGACLGGGLEIALACHIRICSENALFAFPEIHHGIMPGLGGTYRLTNVVGPGKAAEIMLSGDVVNAQKALETGLVDYVVPDRDLRIYTLDYLERLTRDRDVDVIRSIMKSIHNAMHLDTDRALEEETRMFCALAVRSFHNT